MYEFKLTPAYCLFNGAAILEQHGSEIMFLVENSDDVVLQGRLRRAFEDFLETVRSRENCPELYKRDVKVDFVKGTREQLRRCVSGLYKAGNSENQKLNKELEVKQKEAAAVILLDSILHDAKEQKATDIHIDGNCVRFRISGALKKQMELQEERVEELIQRIKMLAGMNIIERHRSQDGRFVYGKNNPIFVRVSDVIVVDTNRGVKESLVLRLLDTSRIPLTLNLLGFNETQLDLIRHLEIRKSGLILVCGSTGSGKSTTIASMLVDLEMRTQGRLKIISMEDPPEYVIPGVSQVQIDERFGNTFDSVLSHIFRQDPDVIMIGEIRDEITAAAAIRASLTGHLVFATLHTGCAGESVLRLENLGVERKMLCSVLRGVIIQELDFRDGQVRLCADIAVPKEKFASAVTRFMSEEEIERRFEHCTNYSEFLSKALECFEVDSTDENQEMHSINLWNGVVNGRRVHKKIG